MNNLIKMLKEIDTQKNSSEDLRNVLNFIANEFQKKVYELNDLKCLIKETEEYYSDGIDEELIDAINHILK